MGHHHMLCGDATEPESYKRLLGTELADMTFCDPPYGVNYANNAKDKLRGKHRPILNDNLGCEFRPFLEATRSNILSVTKGAVYIAISSSELDTLQAAFRAAGGKSGRRSSSGPRTRLRSGALITSSNMNLSCTVGVKVLTISGVAHAIRGMCGFSTSQPRMICTPP